MKVLISNFFVFLLLHSHTDSSLFPFYLVLGFVQHDGLLIIKDWEGQCKSNRVNNKSYENLVGHYQNLFCSTENGVFQVHCKHVAEFFDIISC